MPKFDDISLSDTGIFKQCLYVPQFGIESKIELHQIGQSTQWCYVAYVISCEFEINQAANPNYS